MIKADSHSIKNKSS